MLNYSSHDSTDYWTAQLCSWKVFTVIFFKINTLPLQKGIENLKADGDMETEEIISNAKLQSTE